MAEPSLAGSAATTTDAWLAGRLRLIQPVKGHRVGSDAALLAAAAPAAARVADIGAGVGAVGLAIALRYLAARVDLVEIDPELASLAARNAAANGLAERVRVIIADVTLAPSRRAGGLSDGEADLVATNPPFFAPTDVRASPQPGRARAHVLPGSHGEGRSALAAWIKGALAPLAPGGRFVMIHRPDWLSAILAAFAGRLGAIAILPVHPRAEAPAHRLLIAGVKGARSPLTIRPPIVLHDAAGGFTPMAEALHRGEAAIDWGAL
jgi:tRNA1(Val) A37 N6-methylase TrmN6